MLLYILIFRYWSMNYLQEEIRTKISFTSYFQDINSPMLLFTKRHTTDLKE